MNRETNPWVILLALALLICLLISMASEEWMHFVDVQEQRWDSQFLGKKNLAIIDRMARDVLAGVQTRFESSGASYPPLASGFRTTPEMDSAINFLAQRFELFGNAMERLLRRACMVMTFGPFLAAALMPFLIDALLQWKVRQLSFTYSSPLRHRSSLGGARIVVAILVLTLFIPLPVLPQAYPLLSLLAIHAIAIHFANSPKRL